jgi:hypothetical protein
MSQFNIPILPQDLVRRAKFMQEHQIQENILESAKKINAQKAEESRQMCRPLVLQQFKTQYLKAFDASDRGTFTVDISTTCPDYKNAYDPLFPDKSRVKIEGQTYMITPSFTAGYGHDYGYEDDKNHIVFERK